MWGEELKKYLVEIMKYERKRYEMNLAVLELKKKRGIYERMMGRYTAGETASWKKGKDCWKDKVRMAFAAAYAGVLAGYAGKRIKFLNREIKRFEEEYRRIVQQLREMYRDDVIYPKYQELFPVSRFYEYLSSGRCKGLEGYGGAYDLYENELLAKEILREQRVR